METDKLNAIGEFTEMLGKTIQFNLLTPYRYNSKSFGAELRFAGYNDLILTILDIIKVCVTALDAEECMDASLRASNMNIANVLGFALQLMPMEETQILDECYKLHIKLKEKSE